MRPGIDAPYIEDGGGSWYVGDQPIGVDPGAMSQYGWREGIRLGPLGRHFTWCYVHEAVCLRAQTTTGWWVCEEQVAIGEDA